MSCPCHGCHREAWLTGIERAGLKPLQRQWATLGPADQPDHHEFVTVPSEDGGVVTRPPSLEEQMERIIEQWVGEVRADD